MITEAITKFIRARASKVLAAAFMIILSSIILDLVPGLVTFFPQAPPSKMGLVSPYGDGYFPAQVAAGGELTAGLDPLSQTANFIVNYNPPGGCQTSGLPNFMPTGTPTPWTQEAQAAFNQAVSIWALLLNPDQTIVINACWLDLGSHEPLGTAQPVSAYADFMPGVPVTNTLYPVALANELAGTDLNDTSPDHDGDGNDADAEIIVVMNSHSSINWYFGADANPPAGHFDFVATALHEIGHGLGFVSTMFVDTGDNRCGTNNVGDGCWGAEPEFLGMPAIYDRFVENGAGNNLIDTFPNFSTALGDELTSDSVFFNGPNAKSANGNAPPKLYAPAPFELSGSILHLDNSTYSGTYDQLMTPTYDGPQHHPGPIVLGIFKDIGWNIAELPPVTLTQSASASSVTAGQTLTYTLTVTDTGYVIMSNVIITDTVPANTTLNPGSLSGDATASGTTPGSVITWATGLDLTTAQALSRTFAVTIDSDLTGVSTITNTASVTSTAGVGTNATLYTPVIHNNIDLYNIYLPIILLEEN